MQPFIVSKKPTYKALLVVFVLLLVLLAACTPAAPVGQVNTPSGSPTDSGSPTSVPQEPEPTAPAAEGGFTPQFLGTLDPNDVLAQLTDEPTFTMPEYQYIFGRVPRFTLLADGRLIYVDYLQDGRVMVVQLTPEEAAAMLQEIHDLGFAGLESYTDMCLDQPNGEQLCVADASYTIMRVRMLDGSLREIKNYANFAKDKEAYDAVFNLMNEYTNAQAVQYTPEGATIFVRPIPDAGGVEPMTWPLDPAILENAAAAESSLHAIALKGDDLTTYMGKLTSLGGTQTFEHEGKFYAARVAPWLPGVDYTAEIESSFPQE